jgi:hypothetical protein
MVDSDITCPLQLREAMLSQLQRYWMRETVMASRCAIVGCAALRSITNITCSPGPDATDRRRYCSLKIFFTEIFNAASMSCNEV